MIMYYQTKFGGKKDQQFRRYSRNCHILIIGALAVTLTLKAVIQFFHRTLWLMMMYHQTKFGCQGINSSENIAERVIS